MTAHDKRSAQGCVPHGAMCRASRTCVSSADRGQTDRARDSARDEPIGTTPEPSVEERVAPRAPCRAVARLSAPARLLATRYDRPIFALKTEHTR